MRALLSIGLWTRILSRDRDTVQGRAHALTCLEKQCMRL